MQPPEQPLDVAAAAARLGVRPKTVYDLVAKRRIRHRRPGAGRGKIVFDPQDIEDYIRSRTVEVVEPETGQARPRPDRSWMAQIAELREAAR